MSDFFRPDPKPEKKEKEKYKGIKKSFPKKSTVLQAPSQQGEATDESSISTPDLIVELDGVMSEFIRLIHANPHGMVQCFTCPTTLHWTEIENGHFIPRKHLCTRFLIFNNHPQCVNCNEFMAGNLKIYEMRLDEKYGDGTAEYLRTLSRATCKQPAFYYEELIEAYRICVENLKANLIKLA